MTLSELISEQKLINWATASDQGDEFVIERAYLQESDIHLTLEAPGVISILPNETNHRAIILSCGVHGNETAPIELCEQLFADIVKGVIKLDCRLLLIVGNLQAMREGKRFCDENLNRLFSDKVPKHSNLEVTRAKELMAQVGAFYHTDDTERVHYDLHTAIRDSKYIKFAIYPYLPLENWNEDYLQWLTNADIEAILLSNKLSGTFSCYSSVHFDAHAFTIELGKAKPFGTNDHSTLKGFKSTLIDFITNAKAITHQPTPRTPLVFQVVAEVLRHNQDFTLNLDKHFANFTGLSDGFQLTDDGNDSYYIQGDNKAIVFPNDKVPIGQRVALVIEPRQH